MTEETHTVDTGEGVANITLKDGGDPTEENRQAEEEGVEEGTAIPQQPELTADMAEQFMSQTYNFVTQMHLELSAMANVLINRGLVTKEELNAAFQGVSEEYQRQMQMKAMQKAGIPVPDEVLKAEQEIDAQCGVDVDGIKPPCGEGCGGRKPPTAHGG